MAVRMIDCWVNVTMGGPSPDWLIRVKEDYFRAGDEFNQESTIHFHYLLAENGGFLHEAGSLEEHLRQLADGLAGAEGASTDATRTFIEAFTRPPDGRASATEALADAIEELARSRPHPRSSR